MASEDALTQGQKLFIEALTDSSEREARTELGLLFSDLIRVTRGSELEEPIRHAYSALRSPPQEREQPREVSIEQALKAVVG